MSLPNHPDAQPSPACKGDRSPTRQPLAARRNQDGVGQIDIGRRSIGKVKDLYGEIMAQLDLDFVPNLYNAMASKPDYLEANWNKVKSVMVEPGKLDRLTKEIVAVAVSAVNGCDY